MERYNVADGFESQPPAEQKLGNIDLLALQFRPQNLK